MCTAKYDTSIIILALIVIGEGFIHREPFSGADLEPAVVMAMTGWFESPRSRSIDCFGAALGRFCFLGFGMSMVSR